MMRKMASHGMSSNVKVVKEERKGAYRFLNERLDLGKVVEEHEVRVGVICGTNHASTVNVSSFGKEKACRGDERAEVRV
jgi:hypothetical protein